MSWIKRARKTLTSQRKKELPDGLWKKCDYCSEILYVKELESKQWICSKCGYHFLLSTEDYIALLTDPGSFEETHRGIFSGDPLEFKDMKKYSDRLKASMKKSGKEEAVTTGFAKIGGRDYVLAVLDFSFLGGSMGSVVGEKISRSITDATRLRRPLVIVSRSGGARMQESIYSLMQMAKTSAMLALMAEERVPFISILTHPTTGGVTASFASLGDVIIAEPRALIGFAGPRVIKQTIGQDLPEGFQRSEFLLDHGLIDMIVPRNKLREAVEDLMDMMHVESETAILEDSENEEESPAVS